MVHILVLRW